MTQESPTETDSLRSARFRREREASWLELQALVDKVDRTGAHALSYAETRALATGYRQAVNSLSVARDISLDRALVAYLEQLCARAYLVVYAPQESLRGLVGRLLRQGIPRAVRRSAVPLLIGFAAMILGALAGYQLYVGDPSWYYTFVDPGISGGRTPGASVGELRATIYDDDGWEHDMLAAFASYLFAHNTRIAILVFALGIFAAVPSFVLTFYNGLLLGAFFGLFAEAGLGYDVFAWLSIHGVTELAAICIACAGGAQLGLAVLMPGRYTRRDALRLRGGDATKLLILAAVMLVAAGLIEGFLRQMVQSPGIRLGIGWGIGLLWLLWLALAGRGKEAP